MLMIGLEMARIVMVVMCGGGGENVNPRSLGCYFRACGGGCCCCCCYYRWGWPGSGGQRVQIPIQPGREHARVAAAAAAAARGCVRRVDGRPRVVILYAAATAAAAASSRGGCSGGDGGDPGVVSSMRPMQRHALGTTTVAGVGAGAGGAAPVEGHLLLMLMLMLLTRPVHSTAAVGIPRRRGLSRSHSCCRSPRIKRAMSAIPPRPSRRNITTAMIPNRPCGIRRPNMRKKRVRHLHQPAINTAVIVLHPLRPALYRRRRRRRRRRQIPRQQLRGRGRESVKVLRKRGCE